MKKFIAILLAVLLVSSLSVFAAEQWEADQGNVAFDVQRANTTFKPDGTKSDSEFYDIALQDSWISYTSGNDDGIAATEAIKDVNLAMSYDDTYMYIWLSYTDPNGHFFTSTDHSGFWNGDIIQFSGAEADGTGDDRLEIGLGKYSDTGDLVTVNWYDYLGSGYFAADTITADDAYIAVDGNFISFEFRVPFAAFTTITPAEGAQCRVCLCFCWSSEDAYGTYAVWQLASGVSGGKAAENHALVTLVAAPVVETEAPETEAPAEDTAAPVETPAAQTADLVAVAAVVAVLSLGVAVVAKKH